jgi:SpoVK/Ycf46/Vps4 family AAA+-type ATPase
MRSSAGAELENVCNEAAIIAYHRGGADAAVTQADLEAAVASTTPVATEELLEDYERWGAVNKH